MKIKMGKAIFLLVILLGFSEIYAQIDSGVKTITTYNPSSYYGGNPLLIGDTSGDGRFLVFESNGNIATFNPRNEDRNWEIFLMDYAQRHIFQITNTKHALENVLGSPTDRANILVFITNLHPSISNDGKWIAFASNATSSTPATPNNTNPGNFDGNSPGTQPIIQQDANTEIWLYQIPEYGPADLSSGLLPQFVDFGTGTFTQATNSLPASPPIRGTQNSHPFISTNNDFPSIDDNGATVAFISDRNYISNWNFCQSPDPSCDNNEVFVYKRLPNQVISQVTRTPRTSLNSIQISQRAASISGDGSRVVFQSNGTNPIIGMTSGGNTDFSEEVFLAELNSQGAPAFGGVRRQITESTINTFDLYTYVTTGSRNISRDGRYIILQSKGNLDSTPSTSATSHAAFLFDCFGQCLTSTDKFRQIGPRFDADAAIPYAMGGGLYSVVFTDYNANREPGSLVFESRMNFRPDGMVPTSSSEGLNPSPSRPRQIFAYSLPAATVPFSRLSSSQTIDWGIGAKVIPSNTKERINFLTLKDQNWSSLNLFQLLTPNVIQEYSGTDLQFFTGGGGIGINSGSPQAQGLMPNMLGSIVHSIEYGRQFPFFASEVSNSRNFTAPLQLHYLSLTIDGISANITGVTRGRINFIVPKDLTPGTKSVVINDGGFIKRGTVQIIQTPQPDIVRTDIIPYVNVDYNRLIPKPYGRTRILDVTDPNNPKVEPFNVTTQTPSGTVPTKLRLFLTGVQGVTANQITIKLGNITVPTGSITTNAVESDYPGIYTFDFEVPSTLAGAGHVTVTASVSGVFSRPAETASRTRFLPSQPLTTDLAVWRPGSGVWYILDNNGANPIYVQWGSIGDVPAPGDYDGDGKIDFCIFRPSSGDWWLVRSSNNTTVTFHFGLNGDEIAQADYDGDRITDFAVYRPGDGFWYILQSSTNQIISENLGLTGDKAIPADYDGDGKADLALWKNSTASFWVKGTIENSLVHSNFGQSGDKPVIGDYDGDGIADIATWRASDNTWRILDSNTNQITFTQWGDQSTDVPVQGDYDGDGKTDIAVWKSSGSQVGWWFIKKSTNGQTRAEQWGLSGDIPVPAPW